MKGFRTAPQANRKEKLRELETRLTNLEMASRISQMMTQQIMQNLKPMHEDIGRALGIISELQYKILAYQKVSGLDVTKLNEVANGLRLTDFCEASDKEDAERGFTNGTIVDESSTIILTSITEEKDRGIFRSRIKLSECGVPDLIKAFMGREVGAKALVQLNGVQHEVELLAIRQPAPEPVSGDSTEQDADVSADGAGAADESLAASNTAAQATNTASISSGVAATATA
jgi:hypothetical protein